MEIIKEINYDWMWTLGLILLIIGIILFVIFMAFASELSAIGILILSLGVILLVGGIIKSNDLRFRVKLCDTYTIHELIEQCDSVKYESDYGTWLVRFKQDKYEKCDRGE